MIIKKLDELGLAGNTILIFTSDNGGEDGVTDNSPLRAGKSTLYEGGIRVPFIVRRSGLVKPGTRCNVPVSNYDYYPTLLDCAGIEADKRQHLDGVSLRGLLEGSTAGLNRECLYWHYPLAKPHFLGGRSSGAIRMGDWKLIDFFDTGEVELYNLSRDPGEKNDLAEKMPDKAAQLRKRLGDWRGNVLTAEFMPQ